MTMFINEASPAFCRRAAKSRMKDRGTRTFFSSCSPTVLQVVKRYRLLLQDQDESGGGFFHSDFDFVCGRTNSPAPCATGFQPPLRAAQASAPQSLNA